MRAVSQHQRSQERQRQLMAERLRDLLDYNPITGVFTWKKRRVYEPQDVTWNTVWAGRKAGYQRKCGRRVISVDGLYHLAHRLAWLHVTGEWPERDVVHKDGNYANCIFENLALSDPAATHHKSDVLAKNNTSGFRGVSRQKDSGKFQAYITVDGSHCKLGSYTTLEEAVHARICAEMEAGLHTQE